MLLFKGAKALYGTYTHQPVCVYGFTLQRDLCVESGLYIGKLLTFFAVLNVTK